jgi:tetratricopeptide (TPR) repeat protein
MAALILVVVASCNEVDHTKRIEDHKRLAADLRANSLYGAAIEEYRQVLQYDDLDSVGRGNICYLIGRIYFEDITDYEQAAAWFVRAREYDPNGSYVAEASRNLVTSLEKTGKVLDARRQLGAAANLDGQPASDDDVVVARIGDRNIYISEIEGQIELLPAEVQEQFVGRQKKLEYINQYVGIELLYNAAVRENYLADPKVQKELDRVTRTVLVDRFVTQKIMPGVSIDPVDVRNHYEAHKDDLYGGRPLDSVRTQVTRDYQSVKAEAAYNDYINGLVKAEKVEILGQNVK